jgi:hypothetical protein
VLFVKVMAKPKHCPHGCRSCKANVRQTVGIELVFKVFKCHKSHILQLLYLFFCIRAHNYAFVNEALCAVAMGHLSGFG